jgi:transcriptional regulator with XRE-family HTH domain
MNRSKLIILRRKLGLNQTQFWKRVGVGQSGGSRYENGEPVPRYLRLLIMLAYGDNPLLTLKRMRRER